MLRLLNLFTVTGMCAAFSMVASAQEFISPLPGPVIGLRCGDDPALIYYPSLTSKNSGPKITFVPLQESLFIRRGRYEDHQRDRARYREKCRALVDRALPEFLEQAQRQADDKCVSALLEHRRRFTCPSRSEVCPASPEGCERHVGDPSCSTTASAPAGSRDGYMHFAEDCTPAGNPTMCTYICSIAGARLSTSGHVWGACSACAGF